MPAPEFEPPGKVAAQHVVAPGQSVSGQAFTRQCVHLSGVETVFYQLLNDVKRVFPVG